MNTVQFIKDFKSVQSSMQRECYAALREKISVVPTDCEVLKRFAGLKITHDFFSQTSKKEQILCYHYLQNIPESVTKTVVCLTTRELQEDYLSIFHDFQSFVKSYSFDTITLKLDEFCAFAKHVHEEENDLALVLRYDETLASIRTLRHLTKDLVGE